MIKIMYAHPQNFIVLKTYSRSQNNNAILKEEGPGRSFNFQIFVLFGVFNNLMVAIIKRLFF